MSCMDKTFDKILKGKIEITQFKSGFRYGFDTIFLAAFVNGFLKKYKKKKFHWLMLVQVLVQ